MIPGQYAYIILKSSDFFPGEYFVLYFLLGGYLVLNHLDLRGFLHVDMLADVFLDEELLFHFLLLSYHLMILFFISQHILLVADVIFFQQLHELSTIFDNVLHVRLEEYQLSVHYRCLIVYFETVRKGGWGWSLFCFFRRP